MSAQRVDSRGIVIDNGSYQVKAGFSGDDAPRAVFPPLVGDTVNGKFPIVGDEAKVKRDILFPKQQVIERGIITNWQDMEIVWNHTFYNELRVDPSLTPVLLTEPPINTKPNREKTVELMFEKFGVPATYLAIDSVLSMYESGSTTGVTVDCGHDLSSVVVIYEGYALPHSLMKLYLGGKHLTEYLVKLLNKRGYSFTTTSDRQIVNQIKEKLCYVAHDYEKEMLNLSESKADRENSYKLPCGRIITLNEECFKCPDALFKPELSGLESDGVHKQIYSSIMKCDIDIPQTSVRLLYNNICVAGGGSMIPGFHERLQTEMSSLVPPGRQVQVVAPQERKYSAWIGGSILSSLSTFQDMWVSRTDYDECGPSVVHKKCF